jgi:hypothetical protein
MYYMRSEIFVPFTTVNRSQHTIQLFMCPARPYWNFGAVIDDFSLAEAACLQELLMQDPAASASQGLTHQSKVGMWQHATQLCPASSL